MRAERPASCGPDDPPRPVLVFDGDCGFCRRSVALARRITGDRVEFLAQQVPACGQRFPQLDPRALAESVHWVGPTGEVTHGAEAVALTLAMNPRWRWPLWGYRRVPLVAPLAEAAYRFVARHRLFFSRVSRPFMPGE